MTTDQAERYDRIAEGYARWWAPFLVPAAMDLLDRLGPQLPAGPVRVLDVGTGTGTLGLGAAERWPDVRIDAIDASTEMAAAAEAERDRRLGIAGRDRFVVTVAPADDLPFADGTFDAAMSSFVLQLVPNRHRALREIRRTLRPGAPLAIVTWLRDSTIWRPDEIVDEVLDEFGVDPPADDEEPPDDRADPGDPESVKALVGELRRAGFRAVEGQAATLEIGFDPDGYIGFLTEFDDPALFDSLDPAERTRALLTLRERLVALDPGELSMPAPIVHAIGRRSG
ncbi:MAG TPA: class I SAM-dependent methyltransferase [Candidatus Limnocylindrales bacterium]